MSSVAVTKMHGALNDFVIVDERTPRIPDLPSFARAVCDRRGGIGADGVLAILSSEIGDVRMRVINADGSEAEMCGNGMRCVARYLSEAGDGDRLRVETLAGVIETQIVSKGDAYEVRLNMGVPLPQRRPLPFPDAAFVSLGNPHVVIFASALDAVDLVAVAQELQRSPSFPEGTNVHVAVRSGPQRLDVRHWERGVGLTHACGTGAVACAAAAIVRGMADSPVDVYVPGGRLRVEWDGQGPSYLTGPAVRVFDAQFKIADACAV
ncbi:MAG: diaminopimelate epimerase [Vulcanimicrobiaceae bacterium]